MTSPLDGKVVPFGLAVDKFHEFIHAPEGDIETEAGTMPNLRKLANEMRGIAADVAGDTASETSTAIEDRIYPGVYSTPPTAKPHSGEPPAEGDRCVILVGAVPYEHVRIGGGWVIPNFDSASLSLPSGSSMVGFIQAGIGAVARTQQDKQRDVVSVKDFGAKGDGVTNDAPAIQAAIAALSKTGATLLFPPGTYIQGDGTNPAYPLVAGKYSGPTDIGVDNRFVFNGFKGLQIIGYGAVVAAHPANSCIVKNGGFRFEQSEKVAVDGLTYDGRIDTRAPSGGDASGYNKQSGFTVSSCRDVTFTDVVADRCCMDGFTVESGARLVPADWTYDVTLRNCFARYNYRQGMSVVNATRVKVYGGVFSFTGTIYGTLPMLGIDFEESYNSVLGRGQIDCLVDGATFESNVTSGVALHWGTRNATVQNCKFINNGTYSVSDVDFLTVNNTIRNNTFINGSIDLNGGGELFEGNKLYGDGTKDWDIQIRDGNNAFQLRKSRRTRFANNTIQNDLSAVATTSAGKFGSLVITAPQCLVENNSFHNVFNNSSGASAVLFVTDVKPTFNNNRFTFDRTDFVRVGVMNARYAYFAEVIGNTFDAQYVAVDGNTKLTYTARQFYMDRSYARLVRRPIMTSGAQCFDILWKPYSDTNSTLVRVTYTQGWYSRNASGVQIETFLVGDTATVPTTQRRTELKMGNTQAGVGFSNAYIKGGLNCITVKVPDGATRGDGQFVVEIFAPQDLDSTQVSISDPYTYDTGAGLSFLIPYYGGGSGTTAQRPTVAATGYTSLRVGADYFDSTLGKPIWWTGAAWKDAAGTTV